MTVSVTVATSLFYSSEAFPSRISVGFGNIARPSSSSSSAHVVPLAVTSQTPGGCFTGVIDFAIDPLCQADVVLGGDWIAMCACKGVTSGVESLAVYRLRASSV
jgi:hypothetical protein